MTEPSTAPGSLSPAHPLKPLVRFDCHVFQAFVCFARLRPFASRAQLVTPEKQGRHVLAETL